MPKGLIFGNHHLKTTYLSVTLGNAWNFKGNDTIPSFPFSGEEKKDGQKTSVCHLRHKPHPQPLLQAVMTAWPQDEEDLPQSPFAGQLSPIGA